jgi:hypothetical protein
MHGVCEYVLKELVDAVSKYDYWQNEITYWFDAVGIHRAVKQVPPVIVSMRGYEDPDIRPMCPMHIILTIN